MVKDRAITIFRKEVVCFVYQRDLWLFRTRFFLQRYNVREPQKKQQVVVYFSH